ncbi:MAG TPA: helix-turn-helix domain-containing protein [Actinomycetospora sp.]|nr:helix-turn-helix domain-containing protein [Actinomycetospora sp.]
MVGDVKGPRRPYRSPVRVEQMEATRRRAIEAATRLFVQHGYARTTVAAVAEEAGVSPETIYTSLRGKKGLLEGVIEAAITGPDGAIMLHQQWVHEVRALPTASARLRGWVAASCRTLARTGPVHAVIRGAADREEFAVDLRRRLLERRVDEIVRLAGDLLDGALPPGMTAREAGERYAALASPEMYHLLTVEMGWSAERHREWLTETVIAQILGPS